jgi:hypothetical protein
MDKKIVTISFEGENKNLRWWQRKGFASSFQV